MHAITKEKNANFPEASWFWDLWGTNTITTAGADDTRWMFSNKSSTAYKLPSGHMPDSRTILNLTVFSHLSQINTISLDLAYTWFSHLTWSSHVHLLCIHDSPHIKPSFVFLEVLSYYDTISLQPGQCQVWRVPVI